jgi:hypothetical protein
LKQNVAFFEETGLCLLYEKYRPAAWALSCRIVNASNVWRVAGSTTLISISQSSVVCWSSFSPWAHSCEWKVTVAWSFRRRKLCG